MNKQELIGTLTSRAQENGVDVSRADFKKIFGMFENLAVETVSSGEDVVLSGFMKLSSNVPAKPRRKGDNPFTGEKGVWFKAKPASRRVKITPLHAFKTAVASGTAAIATRGSPPLAGTVQITIDIVGVLPVVAIDRPLSCHNRASSSGQSRSLGVPHEVPSVPLTWRFTQTCWSAD
jgi:nucleoid DNA-binding protein